MRADTLAVTGGIVDELQAVLVGEERLECGWGQGEGFGDDGEEAFSEGCELGNVSLYDWAQLRIGGRPLGVVSAMRHPKPGQ